MQKYKAVVMDIRHKIASGEYARGDRLPATAELCEIYGVSRITIKRAMDDLVSEGLVARRRGSGAYVKGTIYPNGFAGSSSMLPSGRNLVSRPWATDKPVTYEVHDFSVARPPEDIKRILNLEDDELCYFFIRTHIVDGKPETVEYSYLPLRIAPNFRESLARESLQPYIEDGLSSALKSMHQAVGAAHPTPDEAAWLGVDESLALVCVRQVGYLDNGTPIAASRFVNAPGYEFFSVSTL